MSSILGSRHAASAAAFACLVSASAMASPWETSSSIVFSFRTQSVLGASTFTATAELGTYDVAAHTFSWDLRSPLQLFDPTSNMLIATLRQAHVEYVDDPVVNLTFQVQAGPATTEVDVSASLLPFPTINPAQGRASAGL